MSGKDKQSPSRSTPRKILEDPSVWLVHPINIKGMLSFKSINRNIVKGEKTVTKWRVQDGSNELTLAILPVPKKHSNVYSIYNKLFRIGIENSLTIQFVFKSYINKGYKDCCFKQLFYCQRIFSTLINLNRRHIKLWPTG